MIKRWRVIGGFIIGAICMLLVLAGALLSHVPPGVTKENFDRLRIGMTEAEVEQILGPPTPIIDGPRKLLVYENTEGQFLSVRVIFDENGLLCEKTWLGWVEPTYLQKIHRWFGGPSSD